MNRRSNPIGTTVSIRMMWNNFSDAHVDVVDYMEGRVHTGQAADHKNHGLDNHCPSHPQSVRAMENDRELSGESSELSFLRKTLCVLAVKSIY